MQILCILASVCESTANLLPKGQLFNESSWHAYDGFALSDPTSGVGCNYYEDASDPDDTSSFLNVYYKDTSSIELQQSWLSFDGDDDNVGWRCKYTSS